MWPGCHSNNWYHPFRELHNDGEKEVLNLRHEIVGGVGDFPCHFIKLGLDCVYPLGMPALFLIG